MHSLLLSLLLPLTATALPSSSSSNNLHARDEPDIGILTTYFGYDGCNTDSGGQKDQIIQAQKDAQKLAENAVKSPGIDWGNSPAAIDFFGPADENKDQRQHIIDQLNGAKDSWPSIGLGDWWNDRYVVLKCHDDSDKECDGAAAYTQGKREGDKYPVVVFCPGFFSSARPSMKDALATIDKNSVLKGWVSALQSQALTFMHELFHISWGTAQISKPPAKDQWIKVGPGDDKKSIQAYKPGRGKLLAMTKGDGTDRASQNNDNLAYFCAAIWMTGLYDGNYPAKPRAWNPELSIEDNKKNDEIPPGPYTIGVDSLEGFDTSPRTDDENGALTISKDDLFGDDLYPQAYLAAFGSPQNSNKGDTVGPTDDGKQGDPPYTYAKGWCGMHVIQYQKNEDSGPNAKSPDYLIDVTIFDAKGAKMNMHDCNGCGTTARTVALNGAPNVFKTDLPEDMTVIAGPVDDSPLSFQYGDVKFDSNNQEHHSNWGAYDNGKREGDTGFTC